MWRLHSKIHFIWNSFWKFYEVRSKRGDLNFCWQWFPRFQLSCCSSFCLDLIQVACGHSVVWKVHYVTLQIWKKKLQNSWGHFCAVCLVPFSTTLRFCPDFLCWDTTAEFWLKVLALYVWFYQLLTLLAVFTIQ